jgi:hypothetical protein
MNMSDYKDTTLIALNQKEIISIGVFKDNSIIFSNIEPLNLAIEEDIDDIKILKGDEGEIKADNEFEEFDDEIDNNIVEDEKDIDIGIDAELDKEIDKIDTEDINIQENKTDETNPTFDANRQKEEIKNTQNSIRLLDTIKSSIEDFYKLELYESDFIEKIIIATDNKLSQTTKEFIEDEILLDIELINIDTSEILSKLAHEESIDEV